jgi:hypothetical protein
MPPADGDRRREVLHQHRLPAAHVAAIDLQKEGRGAAPGLQAHPVVEDAPVPAMGGVPDRVVRLGCENLRLCVGRYPLRSTAAQKTMRGSRSSTGSWIGGRSRSVSAVNRVSTCSGSVPCDRGISGVEKVRLVDRPRGQRVREGLRDRARAGLHDLDHRRVVRRAPDGGIGLHQRLGQVDQRLHPRMAVMDLASPVDSIPSPSRSKHGAERVIGPCQTVQILRQAGDATFAWCRDAPRWRSARRRCRGRFPERGRRPPRPPPLRRGWW